MTGGKFLKENVAAIVVGILFLITVVGDLSAESTVLCLDKAERGSGERNRMIPAKGRVERDAPESTLLRQGAVKRVKRLCDKLDAGDSNVCIIEKRTSR